jgi:hypothetical protein
MRIEIWTKDKTTRLSVLTSDNEDAGFKFTDLEYSSNTWGFQTASFTLKRSIKDYWEDLEDSLLVKIYHATLVWEGDIEGVDRQSDEEESYQVQCVGLSSRLKNQGTDYNGADLDPAEKMSTFITDHILTDTDLGLTAGIVDTDDFEFITGLTFFPGKTYQEMLDEANEFNGYRPCVWEDGEFSWAPRETAPSYFVNLEDCEKTTLNRTREKVKNWVQVAYSPDGSTYGYEVDFDQDSIDLHGKRCLYLSIEGDDVEAAQVADTALAQLKDLKPLSSLTTDVIYDQYGSRVDPEEVRAGKVVTVRGLLSTEETIGGGINESHTWEIGETSYKDGKVSMSPGGGDDRLDVLLKQFSNKSDY